MNNSYTLMQIKKWLKDNDKTQYWLADQIGMSSALLSQVFNGKRKLQTRYIISISKIINIPLEQLMGTETEDKKQPQIELRGRLSKPESEKQVSQLLWDIQHCVDLEASVHER